MFRFPRRRMNESQVSEIRNTPQEPRLFPSQWSISIFFLITTLILLVLISSSLLPFLLLPIPVRFLPSRCSFGNRRLISRTKLESTPPISEIDQTSLRVQVSVDSISDCDVEGKESSSIAILVGGERRIRVERIKSSESFENGR